MTYVAIIGAGVVGGNLARFFKEQRGIQPVIHDPPKGESRLGAVHESDVAFVCVPTPCDTMLDLPQGDLRQSDVRSVPALGD